MDSLAAEAARVEEDCLYSARGHFEAARRWERNRFWIGMATAIVAGVSGVTALLDHPVVAGTLAILAACLAAALTVLDATGRSATHHGAGARYNALRNRARLFREVDLVSSPAGQDPSQDPVAQLKTLAGERDELNGGSPQIPRGAFERARRGIEAGEARHRVDGASEGSRTGST